MTVHYQDDTITVHAGDCLDVLRELPDSSVDSVVTDPPYGLEFMGKDWDSFGTDTSNGYREKPRITDRPGRDGTLSAYTGAGGKGINHFQAGPPFQRWCTLWAAECLRVLKPGGHMLTFGGTRTSHRLACAIEDAGFEIRDSIAWLYGSGFPKSLDVSKAIDKSAGVEREVLSEGAAVKRMIPGADQNKTGSWIKDNGREYVPTETAPATDDARTWEGWGTALKPAHEPIVVARKPLAGTVAANVLEHGTGALNIDGCRTEFTSEADLAEAAGKNRHADFGSGPRENKVYGADNRARADDGNYDGSKGRWPANVILDESQAAELNQQSGVLAAGNHPANRAGDRADSVYALGHTGTQGERRPTDVGGAARFFYVAKAGTDERVRVDGIAHPTVKPLALMRWLVRLVTPPGGTVLEPFAGSGTTVEACILENFSCVAIEREPIYLPLITQRINRRRNPVAAVKGSGEDGGLFDLLGEETA